MRGLNLDFSWISRLGKARRENRFPKSIGDFQVISESAFDGLPNAALEFDEAREIGKPVKVYGILRGQYEWEELDEQLFLSKEKARSQCLSYVETANFQPPFKDQYAETSEGYWSTGDFESFIQLKEFTLS